MALISFTPLQDGVTGVNAAATNTPLSTIYNDHNGNITDANIAAGAAIAANKLAGGSAGMFGAWTAWTPSFTNFTTTNATITAAYIQLGKTVIASLEILFGAATAIGTNPSFTPPVTAATIVSGFLPIGTCHFDHTGVGNRLGNLELTTTTNVRILTYDPASYLAATQVTNTIPITLGNGDKFACQFVYQAA